jgi:hypothetical protein
MGRCWGWGVLAFVASIFLSQCCSGDRVLRFPCAESDKRLVYAKNVLTCSLDGGPAVCKTISAQGDWPNQAIYMNNVLEALVDPTTCLNTTTAKQVVEWMDITSPSRSTWWYTWYVFQVQYYDMPRVPGARIESPATLGRKCWAFAYLTQVWEALKPAIERSMSRAGLDMGNFTKAYDGAIPLTMDLCDKVMANCFVNATYAPAKRNGTCPNKAKQFYVGFQWENGNNNVQWRNDSMGFPFPQYDQTKEWQEDVQFSVNTALNFII